ncbi:MAG: sigma-70 RNA polymerase sigma factor region 4 domain-containing protein [Pirellulaceae bacterium]
MMCAAKLAGLPRGSNQHTKEDEPNDSCSRSEAALLFNVGTKSVQRALDVLRDGCAELAIKVYREEARERQATSTGGRDPQLKVKVPEADDAGQARDKAGRDLTALRQEQVQHAILRLDRLGWTQGEIAEQSGMTQGRVSQILLEIQPVVKLTKTDSASFPIEQVAERNRISHQLAASIGCEDLDDADG